MMNMRVSSKLVGNGLRAQLLARAFRSGLLVAGAFSLVACPRPVTNKNPPPKPPPVVAKATQHLATSEATTANVGAPRCSLSVERKIGALAKDGGIAIGFGDHGGLVAWTSPQGIRVKPLHAEGKTNGPAVAIPFPRGTEPVEIAPIGQGFVILSRRTETTEAMCPGTCIDPTCAGTPAGAAQPQVCKKPCAQPCNHPKAHDYFVQYTDLEGNNSIAGVPFRTGPSDIVATVPGDGQSIAFLTTDEIIWIRTRADGKVESERLELPKARYVLPVRGFGPPTLILADEDGAFQVLEERRTWEAKGSLVDKKSGRLLDARLQSRWANKTLHIAHQAWQVSLDSIQYGTIENQELRLAGEPQKGGFREPFAEYVEIHSEDGQFRRTSWLQKTVGEDIDIHSADSEADVSRARFAWSGKVFAFAYPTNPMHREVSRAVGIVAADCSGRAP